VVAAAGKPSEGRELPVVEIMLNPFSQRVLQIGKMLVGSEWTPANDLKPLIQRDYGGCPTVVLISNQVTDGVRFDLGVSNSHVEKDRKKIHKGVMLSPLLLVRSPELGRVIVADGYHRLCAVYSIDEYALIPFQIV
jgi:hypothetical protein